MIKDAIDALKRDHCGACKVGTAIAALEAIMAQPVEITVPSNPTKKSDRKVIGGGSGSLLPKPARRRPATRAAQSSRYQALLKTKAVQMGMPGPASCAHMLGSGGMPKNRISLPLKLRSLRPKNPELVP